MLNEILKTQLSLEEAAKKLQLNFETALMLFNSLLSFPVKILEKNPAALKNAVEFYRSIFESYLPERNESNEFDEVTPDQDYFNSLCLPVAKGIYDCVKLIDYKTKFSRSYLAEVQNKIYSIYDSYIAFSQDSNTSPVLQFLSYAILGIDKIFEYGKIERRETLMQPTDLYVFVGRVYPSVTPEEFEENLNRFVQENNLKGDKLFLLPKGFEVKYYV